MNFLLGFQSAYKWGMEGGCYLGGLITGLKKMFKNKLHGSADQYSLFLSFQTSWTIKFISIQSRGGLYLFFFFSWHNGSWTYIWGGGTYKGSWQTASQRASESFESSQWVMRVMRRRLGFQECFLCSGHVTYHIWCDSLNVTEEEPLNLCFTNSQTFVIVSPRSICMLANFSEAEF